MNINQAVDKEFEGKNLKELAQAPLSALQGISEEGAAKIVEALRIQNNIRALGECKYFRWAEAVAALADMEE